MRKTNLRTRLEKLENAVFDEATLADIVGHKRTCQRLLKTYSIEQIEAMYHEADSFSIPFRLIADEPAGRPLREAAFKAEAEHRRKMNWTAEEAEKQLREYWRRNSNGYRGKIIPLSGFMEAVRADDVFIGKVDFEAFENEVKNMLDEPKPPPADWEIRMAEMDRKTNERLIRKGLTSLVIPIPEHLLAPAVEPELPPQKFDQKDTATATAPQEVPSPTVPRAVPPKKDGSKR